MGNFWEKSGLKREEVEKNIFQINEITKTLIFMKKLKIYLNFELDDDSLINRQSRRIIKVTIYDYDDKTSIVQKREEPLLMTIDDFYKYFNLLINSRSMFLTEQMKERMGNLKKSNNQNLEDNENASGICPICAENNVDISLPCSHFFCNKCIKTWIGKSDSCPLCRYKLKLNKKNPTGINGGQTWDVVEDIDQDQIEKEYMESLELLTKKFFFDKNSISINFLKIFN